MDLLRSRAKLWLPRLQTRRGDDSRLQPTHNKRLSPSKIYTQLMSVQDTWDKYVFKSQCVQLSVLLYLLT